MPNCSEILKFHLFADDTSIFFSHKNQHELEIIVNNELKKVSDWLSANRLTLNVAKSNFLLLSKKKSTSFKTNIMINDTPIVEKNYIKYLGVLIDNNLNWKQHIKQINIKISKGIGILAKMRYFVPQAVLRNLYNAFISPHINYAITAWGNAPKYLTNTIHTNLNKAVRIICFEDFKAKATPLFSKLKLLKFEDCCKLETAKFMHDIYNNNDVSNLNTLFEKANKRHNYKTRHATNSNFSLPFIRTDTRKKFLAFNGVKIWNQVPIEIKNTRSKINFTKLYRNYILQTYSAEYNKLSKSVFHPTK